MDIGHWHSRQIVTRTLRVGDPAWKRVVPAPPALCHYQRSVGPVPTALRHRRKVTAEGECEAAGQRRGSTGRRSSSAEPPDGDRNGPGTNHDGYCSENER